MLSPEQLDSNSMSFSVTQSQNQSTSSSRQRQRHRTEKKDGEQNQDEGPPSEEPDPMEPPLDDLNLRKESKNSSSMESHGTYLQQKSESMALSPKSDEGNRRRSLAILEGQEVGLADPGSMKARSIKKKNRRKTFD